MKKGKKKLAFYGLEDIYQCKNDEVISVFRMWDGKYHISFQKGGSPIIVSDEETKNRLLACYNAVQIINI